MKRLIILALIAGPLAIVALDRIQSSPGHLVGPPAFAFPEPPTPPPPPIPPGPPRPEVASEQFDAPQGRHRVVKRVIVRAGSRGHDHAGSPDKAGGLATCCFDGEPASSGPGPERVVGGLMADEERALQDLRRAIDERVSDWLAEVGVPRDWKAPGPLVSGLIRGEPEFEAEEREYGIDGLVHRASVPVDLSRANRERLVGEYHRQVSSRRLGLLGAGLAFVLASLAVYAGYVRSDEATKGYYTNRLRLLAAGAVGAAGVILYQMVA